MIKNAVFVLLLVGLSSLANKSFAEEADGPAAGPTSVLIFNLESDDELKDLAKSLTEELLLHLGQKSEIAATGESEIAVMLAHEKDKKLLRVVV